MAGGALADAGSGDQAVRFADDAAARTDRGVRPALLFELIQACFFSGEALLEPGQRVAFSETG